MRALKEFKEFVKERIVIKQSPDIERAKSLITESKEKLEFYEKLKNKLGFEELNSNYIIETCYDIIMVKYLTKIIQRK